MKTESRHPLQEAAVTSMLSRLFAAADGASGKKFDEAFRVRVVGASTSSQTDEGGTAIFRKISSLKIYRDRLKRWFVVARNFFLLLRDFSAWPCQGPA